MADDYRFFLLHKGRKWTFLPFDRMIDQIDE